MDIEVPRRETITGVILAGGMARRMGGQDKGLIPFSGRPLVEWVIAALEPQVNGLFLNANRNQETYAAYGHPVVSDATEGFQGPLAGLASAMAAVSTPWIVTAPCDGPFLAPDLVERLCAALLDTRAQVAVATDGERTQPLYALIPVALAPNLRAFLAAGERKAHLWYAGQRVALAAFGDRPEGFININRPADCQRFDLGQGT